MATPFKDPRTGVYQFRRAIPESLRPFFDGRREYKKSLETKDPSEAKRRFAAPAAEFEVRLANARNRQLAARVDEAREMVDKYLRTWPVEQIQLTAWRLSYWETQSFAHSLGLKAPSRAGNYNFGWPPSTADFQDHAARVRMLEAVPDLKTIPWYETLQRVAQLPTLQPVEWAVNAICYEAGIINTAPLEVREAIGRAFIARLCEACLPEISHTRHRIVPPPIIVGAAEPKQHITPSTVDAERAEQPTGQPKMTISAVFEDWATAEPRNQKIVDEWRSAIGQFTQLHGDLPVDQITSAMVRDFRRVSASLPKRASGDLKKLPLREQVEVAKRDKLTTRRPKTVNKALSGIRVTLEHSVEELDQIEVNPARLVRSLPKDEFEDARLPFSPADMGKIFSSPLPEPEENLSRETFVWTLLLAPFTGARLGEIACLRPINVKREQGIDFIAIERDRIRVRESSEVQKRAKTSSALRDIPVHSFLIRAGFLKFVERRQRDGAEWLFPEIVPDQYGSRATRLSRVFNDFLDDIGLCDPELVFHSFRHSGKRVLRGKAQPDLIDIIFGHADGSVSSKYGRGAALDVMRDAIENIAYEGVDWNKVLLLPELSSALPDAKGNRS